MGGYSDVVIYESHLPVLLLPVTMVFTSWRGDGEGGSSPVTSPSWAAVSDCLHLPLAAPADPPR